MHFAAHAKGGAAAGAVVTGLAWATGAVSTDGAWAALVETPFGPGPVQTLAGHFATTWFMALFPDLDVTSVPQRWYVRGAFAALGLAYLAERMDVFAVLAFAALMPLLHRHRGWTHQWWAPWAVAFFLALVHEHLRASQAWFFGFAWANVWGFLLDYWTYVLACVAGHYTHLLLDRPHVRGLRWIRNLPGHH